MSLMTTPPDRARAFTETGVRRIAIVRALQLGDLLLAVPAFRAIRRGFPAAEITLIGLAWSREFVDRFRRYLDRWLEFPGFPGIAEAPYVPELTQAFFVRGRAYHYDLAIQLHGNGRVSNHFTLELGARKTIGFSAEAPVSGLNSSLTYPDDCSEIDRNLRLVSLLDLPTDDRRLEWPIEAADLNGLRSLDLSSLVGRGPLVALHPGARPSARRWPVGYFAEVGATLANRLDARIVVTGGPNEIDTARSVVDRMTVPALNLAGQTTLGTLAALIDRCDVVISNDTGPAHLAVALDRPSVTIFGPADRRRWAPLDRTRHSIAFEPVDCNPCPHQDCPIDHRCLVRVTPDRVIDLALRLLEPSVARGGECEG